MSFSARLTSLRGKRESSAAFARRMGKSTSTVREWLYHEVTPSQQQIREIAVQLQVSPLWLSDGAGPRDLAEFVALMDEYQEGKRREAHK